jgi:hypothetical protein
MPVFLVRSAEYDESGVNRVHRSVVVVFPRNLALVVS